METWSISAANLWLERVSRPERRYPKEKAVIPVRNEDPDFLSAPTGSRKTSEFWPRYGKSAGARNRILYAGGCLSA
jgi:hypothetical protein